MPDSRSRFLVIRLSSIGDIVHALPAVATLGGTFPSAEIHWAVESRYAPLLESNPFVHTLVRLDTLAWRKDLFSVRTMWEIGQCVRTLRRSSFDASIDFQGLYKSGLITGASGARERVGFAEPWLREFGAALFYTDHVAPREETHVIEMNLALVERVGARRVDSAHWQFPLPRTLLDDAEVDHRLARLEPREFIILNPGGGWKAKRWPPRSYSELIRLLERELPWTILLTGSDDEETLAQDILRAAGSPRAFSFRSNLVQFIALARRAKLFVGGDTGPLHLAAAVRAPIVGLYGPTDPARNGPFAPDDIALWNGGPVDYSRRHARTGSLSGIDVETVYRAVRQRLERAHG